jgi:arylformamidase
VAVEGTGSGQSLELIDITVPVREGMPVYDRNPGVRLELAQSLERGDGANVSRLDFGTHTGTHVDAPNHFLPGAAGIEALPLEAMIGPAHVVDATSLTEDIDAAALEGLDIPAGAERLLLKTKNSRLWELDHFTRDFIRLVESGARFCVERGMRLVGIDYLSVGDPDAHRVLLEAGVVPLEGVDLRAVEPGSYELICLPIKLVGSDGGPARAVLTRGLHR